MRKLDLGQAITILANIGVIAGIGFLAIELHQNNALLEAEARFNHKETRSDFQAVPRDNRSFAEILIKAQSGSVLSPVEQLQLDSHWDQMFTTWEWEYFEWRTGRLDLPVEGYRTGMSRAGALERWEESRFRYRADFVEWVNANVAGISPRSTQ